MTKKFIIMTLSLLVVSCITLTGAHAVVYRPGLIQAKVSGDVTGKNQCSNYPSNLTSTVSAELLDRTLDTMMANFRAENANTYCLNPVSGKSWNWDNYITFAYEGEIWLESGVAYNMFEQGDDGSAVLVDGAIVTTAGATSRWQSGTGATLTPTRTGWHRFNAFSWDWDGGKGPAAGCWGLCWNTNGVEQTSGTIAIDTPPWAIFADPGDMTFLKTATDEQFMALNSIAVSDGDLIASMTFDTSVNATLYLLHGAGNGGDINLQAWDGQTAAASISTGNFTTNIVISGIELEDEPWLCFYLRSTPEITDPLHVFEEWLVPFQASAAPGGAIAVDAVEYIEASFTATVASFGLGGVSASLYVEIASDEDFETIMDTIEVSSGIIEIPAVVSDIVNVVELTTNTTYYARAKIVNQNSAVGYSDAVPFTTLIPEPPVVSGILTAVGFDYGNFAGSLADYGAGSTNALLYVDVSETSDFAAYVTFGGTNIIGQLPSGCALRAEGLVNGAAYYARIRAVNSWELEDMSPAILFETRGEPFAVSPISASVAEGGTRLEMSISDLAEGAVVNATLSIGTTTENTTLVESWNGISTFPATLSYMDSASSGTFLAKCVLTSTYAGTEYALTNTLWFTAGLNTYVALALDDLAGLRLKVGESVALPELSVQSNFYRILNGRVGEFDSGGTVITAIGPGGTGVELWEYDPALGEVALSETGGLIVAPEPIGGGRVYLFRETASAWNWNDAANWECVSDPGYIGYPNAVDDVAMILYYNQGGKTMTIGTTGIPSVTIGELYAGQLKSVATNLRLQGGNSEVRSINFKRSNGDAARIQLTGGAHDSKEFNFYLGGNGDSTRLTLNAVSDIEYDAGYTFVDDTQQRSKLSWDRLDVDIPEGRTFRIVNGHPAGAVNQGTWCYIGPNTRFTGAGLLWHDSMLNVQLDYTDFMDFSGTIRDTGFGHGWYDRSANIQFKTPYVPNAALEISGFVTKDFNGSTSAGYCAWGINHGYGDSGPVANRMPERSLTISGGLIEVRHERNTSWGAGSVQTNMTDLLEIGKGLSCISMYVNNDFNESFPTNTFTVGSLAAVSKGTLVINEPRTRNNNNTIKGIVTLNGFAEHAVGGSGDLESETYPVIPWIVAWHGNQYTIRFAAVNEQNQMHRPVYVNVAPDDVADPLQNVYADNQSIALGADLTINSLWLQNRNKSKRLGENRTLTISSGGLILHGDATKIGEQSGGVENGSLVFGNTAYIYTVSTSDTAPAEIWARVAAPQGLVCGYFGNLLLAGDQTGIKDEIVVNNGKLFLGSLDGTVKAQIDADVRIVSQNATVKVNVPGTLDNSNVLFDDAFQFAGKIELPPGQTEKCRMLFIGDSEKSMPRGTYGSSASGAEFIDDVHFLGTGILDVTRDNLTPPTIMVVH